MILQIVVWLEDRACERSWLPPKIVGATAAIVTASEKVTNYLLVPNINVIDASLPNRRRIP